GAEEEVEEADAEEEPPRRGLGDAALEGQAGGEVPRVHGPYPACGDGRRGGRLGARSSHARRGTGPADMTRTERASPAAVRAPKVGGVRRNGKPAAPSERDAPGGKAVAYAAAGGVGRPARRASGHANGRVCPGRLVDPLRLGRLRRSRLRRIRLCRRGRRRG